MTHWEGAAGSWDMQSATAVQRPGHDERILVTPPGEIIAFTDTDLREPPAPVQTKRRFIGWAHFQQCDTGPATPRPQQHVRQHLAPQAPTLGFRTHAQIQNMRPALPERHNAKALDRAVLVPHPAGSSGAQTRTEKTRGPGERVDTLFDLHNLKQVRLPHEPQAHAARFATRVRLASRP